MDREDIIRMAAYSGMELYGLGKDREKFIYCLTAFATLVASAERDDCAELCEMLDVKNPKGKSWDEGTIDCAEAIRARGRV